MFVRKNDEVMLILKCFYEWLYMNLYVMNWEYDECIWVCLIFRGVLDEI